MYSSSFSLISVFSPVFLVELMPTGFRMAKDNVMGDADSDWQRRPTGGREGGSQSAAFAPTIGPGKLT
jgi:hypothetical protein